MHVNVRFSIHSAWQYLVSKKTEFKSFANYKALMTAISLRKVKKKLGSEESFLSSVTRAGCYLPHGIFKQVYLLSHWSII